MMPKTLGGWIVVVVFVCSIITILKMAGLLELMNDPSGVVPNVNINPR